jgi:uncharacterized protein (TIGR02147 family)
MANYASSAKILKSSWRRLQNSPSAISLRKLAAGLSVSPGYLSKIFSGQAPIPKRMIDPLIKKLELDPATRDQLIRAVTREALREKVGVKTSDPATSPSLEPDAIESYELGPKEAEWILGRWYRTALLDLTTLKGFRNDTVWIARRLGISIAEVERSIAYLKDAGLLTETAHGGLRKIHLHLRFPSSTSKKVFRQHHISQMKRAIQTLENQTAPKDFSMRFVSGVTFACDPSQIEKVKVALNKALYEATQTLSRSDCTEVYQLNLQLFPHTRERT